MRAIVAAILQILGLVAIVAGCWVLAPAAGVVVAGVEAVVVGIAVDPPTRATRRGDA